MVCWLRLLDIHQACAFDLYDWDNQTQFGGVGTTHVRINVSPRIVILAAPKILTDVCQLPSHNRRAIAMESVRPRDFRRAPIILGRFMKHVP